MNSRFLSIFIILISFLSSAIDADENESAKTDILFLKIQELEIEIAELRNKIESQNYLIEKLIDESLDSSDEESENTDDFALDTDIRFKGIEDPNSKDQVYSAADKALRAQDYDKAFTLFNFFVNSFNDNEKKPLSYFWLGEISLTNNDLDKSKDFFMELISSYPNHYRVPLAHKKIGDIYLKSNELDKAKDKYNFVVREYPNNTASSLALQLLKNME
tara:strand:+ start:3018 stop:3671 length:654 start_codon:yes stop_codon:yes gene_type:complete